jgi:tetrapyrrole methylase family protein/MazG family protein
MARSQAGGPPVITIVGLGPAGTDAMTASALATVQAAVDAGAPVFFRTRQHPAAAELLESGGAGPDALTFDDRYTSEDTFEAVYGSIAGALLEAAGQSERIVYAVPGSPLVAERTVELLRAASLGGDVVLEFVPGMSFCDLAWARLGIDPLAAGVRLVDATAFALTAAGDSGPLLIAQCWSKAVLSEVKLAVEEPSPDQRAVILHHLGLRDEVVVEVAWEDLDRTVGADHLTSVFVEHLAAPVAAELVRLSEVVARLRRECPWDQEQTHQSLVRHLLEETYEAIEAIEALGEDPSQATPEQVAHVEEELGDVLCQVVFHATLAREEGLFELSDIARTITDKLVRRHPHVFADVVAETASDVVTNWERLKREEKGRKRLLDGIPAAMPALARAATIERKLASAGLGWHIADPAPGPATAADPAPGPADPAPAATPGERILAIARAAAAAGEDPEAALRRALDRLVEKVGELEAAAAERGVDVSELPAADRAALEIGSPPPPGTSGAGFAPG